MSSLQSKKILLAVTGSIAAYKSVILLRLLQKAGAEVKVIMTPSAAKFVAPLTFASLSKSEVYTDVVSNDAWNNHVELGLWADAMIIAPCTANTIAGMVGGFANNIVLAVYLSAKCPVYYAPAMDRDMWKHPSTLRNRKQLSEDDIEEIPIGSGYLASGLIGEGRMAEPEDIVSFLVEKFQRHSSLVGKRVLITAGPTKESLDPVRFLSNHSTGKMGICLAEEAANRGAAVILVLGPTDLRPKDDSIEVVNVVSAQEMYESCQKQFDTIDLSILSAAVADYRPAKTSNQKIKKSGSDMSLQLERTTDIAASLGKVKKKGQVLVGFALETQNAEQNAFKKIEKKNFDCIVLNTLANKGAGFGKSTNKVSILKNDGSKTEYGLKPKEEVAIDILDYIENNYFKT